MKPSRIMQMCASAGGGGGGSTDPNFSSVKLLMGFEGTDASTTLTDESSSAHAMTANGNAQIDTAQFKFGSSSLLLDGTGDYAKTPDHADFTLGSGDYTVELWVRWNSVGDSFLCGNWGGSRGSTAFIFYMESGKLWFDTPGLTNGQVLTSVLTTNANQWYHIVGERSGSIIRIYRDGAQLVKQTSVSGTAIDSSSQFTVGGGGNGSDLNGWIDEFRYTKGVARYDSDSGYTVPSAAFPRS